VYQWGGQISLSPPCSFATERLKMEKIKVWVHKGRNEFKYALIDDDDYDKLSNYIWRITNTGYANRKYKSGEKGYKNHHHRKITMHREIMKCSSGQIDHINRNRLDNRKSNLRICSQRINCFNSPTRIATSKFRGVYFDKFCNNKNKRWIAQINISVGKRKNLGYFGTEVDAAKIYNKTATELLGEFANLNKV